MCAGCTLFYASFSLVIPELPHHFEKIGHPGLKGLGIALFAITSLFIKPFSGKLTDIIGRKPVMLIGVIACIICGLFYTLSDTLVLLIMVRLFHGFSAGFTPTGNTAAVADIVHPSKRGEGMGILGMANNIGTAIGAFLGSVFAGWFGINGMYITSSLMAMIAFLLFFNFKETLHQPKKFHVSMLKIDKHNLFDIRVLVPGLVMLSICFVIGGILTVIPDVTQSQGYSNKGLFVGIYIMSSLFVRIISGRFSDRYGRKFSAMIGCACITISLLLLAFGYTIPWVFFTAAVFFGFGQGFNAPTLFAWATDLSKVGNLGRGMSTLFIFLEFGIAAGALFSGFWFNNDLNQLYSLFLICAGVSFAGFLVSAFAKNVKRIQHQEIEPVLEI